MSEPTRWRHEGKRRPPIPFRRIFFLSLALSFLSLTPIIILRAMGYRLDATHRRIVAVGAIAVDVQPPGIELDIEGLRMRAKRAGYLSQTLFFPNLLPGTYRLNVAAVPKGLPEVAPWSKEATVAEGLTTWFPFVRLFPAHPETIPIQFPRTPNGIAMNRSGDRLAGWDHNGVRIIDLAEERELTELQSVIAGDVAKTIWLTDRALVVGFANGTWLILEETDGGDPRIIPLPAGLRDVTALTEQQLIARTDHDDLVILERNPTGIAEHVLAEDVIAFATANERISYLDSRGILWSMNRDGSGRHQENIDPLTLTPPIVLRAANDGASFTAIDGTQTAWLLRKETGAFTILADGVRDAIFSQDSAKLLLVAPHEISLIALRERLDQPVRHRDAREVITRLHERILDAAFLPPEEEHVIIRTASSLRIEELDGRGGRNEARYPDIATFTVSGDAKKLFLVQENGVIAEMRIPQPGPLVRLSN